MRARVQPLIIAALTLFPPPAASVQRQQGAAAPVVSGPARAPDIPFETYTLPNGLTVTLSPDKSTPTVAVNVWYKVGSKDEQAGRTGFAHLFEHMMFTGSGNAPYGLHDKLTEGVGGMHNGTTNNSRTVYYETVPSNYLESTLWLEADRMGSLLETLNIEKLNAQRDIVKNERRERVDNQPYGRGREILIRAVYPATHPYSWPVIGSMDDLSAATVEDVKDFFRTYYAPSNAFLTVVGDFQALQAKSWISKYFGEIPKGAPISRPVAEPVVLSTERRLVHEDRVAVPRLWLMWPTVGERHDDRFALNVLRAVLVGSRTARLTKALVYEEQSAATVTADQLTSEDVGEFAVRPTPRPGHSLTNLETAAEAVIERLKREGPTAEEVAKAVAGVELTFIRSLESNLEKSLRLADGAGYHGDPGYFKTEYRKAISVTPEDVKRVANKYLSHGRVTLSIVPIGALDQAAKPDQSVRVTAYDVKETEGGK